MASLIYQRPVQYLEEPNYEDWIDIDLMADQPPRKNPSFFKGEFSFVNKDAKNIDSKDHNAAVSWHVMNRYERWKKQEQAKKLRASANVPLGPMSSPSTSQAVRRYPSLQDRRQNLTVSQPADTSSTPSATFPFDPWMADQPLQAGYSKPSPIESSTAFALPSVTSTPSTHSSVLEDPFASMWNTSATSLDLGEAVDTTAFISSPLIDMLIVYAYGSLIPSIWPTEPGSNHGAYEIARSWDDITAIYQDKCYANAYLGLLATAMAETNDDEAILLQARQFQGQAMVELRQRVSRNTAQDLLTLKTILKLFSTETMSDNTAVARVHLKMLRNLVTAGGGVILLDSWFREDLLSCDGYFALKYGTRPTLPPQEWTPGPLSQPWKARLLSAGIFGDHSSTVDPLIEHPILKAVVIDVRELFQAHEYVLTHDVPTDDQLLRWRQLRKFDCISRLADHYTNLIIYPHLYDKPNTQALCTVAIALATSLVLGCPESVRFGLKLLSDLKQRFQESESESDGTDTRLRLWAAYIGSLAEKVHPVPAADMGSLAVSMKALVRKMKIEGLDEMKKILRQLLYSERLHQEIESGRDFRKSDFRTGLYTSSGTSWREPVPIEPMLVETASPSGETSVAAGKQRADDG